MSPDTPRRSRFADRWSGTAVLVCVVLCLAGCARVRESPPLNVFFDEDVHYRVMSRIFDGVPDPHAPPPEEAPEGQVILPRGERPLAPAQMVSRLRQAVVHAPVADRECNACHTFSGERGATSSIQNIDISGYGKGGATAALLLPLRELCVDCHDEYSPATAEREGFWLHGPVGAGDCLFCHLPHRSQYPHLLRAEPPQALCVQCHVAGMSGDDSDYHPPRDEPDTDCTDCHDPHRGASRSLL